jgi:DNA-binding response OmpR family regulator
VIGELLCKAQSQRTSRALSEAPWLICGGSAIPARGGGVYHQGSPFSRDTSEKPIVRVLVIEDSVRMARSLKRGLSEECYAVDLASDGETGLHMAEGGEFDLVLLDINLPDMDGLSVIRELRRRRSDVPVIMVTARDDIRDRIEGLDAGADDYITKPFAFEELLARIRATMRRPGARAAPVFRYDDIELNPARGQAMRAGRPLSLSAREFALLQVFLASPDHLLTRTRLYEAVWDSDYDGLSNVLDVYVNYLRTKLERDGGRRVIHTVRGRGYLFGQAP